MKKYNVAIIGGGVMGLSIAKEFLDNGIKDIVLLEKNADVMLETSTHNSGLVHGGFDATPGTLKARFNVEGRHLFEKLYFEKNTTEFKHLKIDSYILAFDEKDVKELDKLYDQGIKNGLKPEEMKIISGDEVRKNDPNISEGVIKAFVCTSSTVIDPHGFGLYLLREAKARGLELKTSFEVVSIGKSQDAKSNKDLGGYVIKGANGELVEADFIINAAGSQSEKIARIVEENPDFEINLRRGQYLILDRTQKRKVKDNVYFLTPSVHGKGVIVAPQFDGRVLVGPSVENFVPLKDIQLVSDRGLNHVRKIGLKINPSLNMYRVETVMAGSRAVNTKTNDYHIEMSNNKDIKMLHVAGMQSPALSGSPAIAKYVFEKYSKNK